jgi:putative Holliday junction resolvase
VTRAIGVDLGARRIGIAVSDPGGVLATPVTVLTRTKDRVRLHRQIAEIVQEYEAAVVVVGLPLSLDGSDGPAAVGARAEAQELAAVVGVPVQLHDERLTTVTAHRLLAATGIDERARRKVIDSAAAAVLLQTWLDGRSVAEPPT